MSEIVLLFVVASFGFLMGCAFSAWAQTGRAAAEPDGDKFFDRNGEG